MVCLLSLLGKQDELLLANFKISLQRREKHLFSIIILSILGKQEDLLPCLHSRCGKRLLPKMTYCYE
jgi:hypothetical protein